MAPGLADGDRAQRLVIGSQIRPDRRIDMPHQPVVLDVGEGDAPVAQGHAAEAIDVEDGVSELFGDREELARQGRGARGDIGQRQDRGLFLGLISSAPGPSLKHQAPHVAAGVDAQAEAPAGPAFFEKVGVIGDTRQRPVRNDVLIGEEAARLQLRHGGIAKVALEPLALDVFVGELAQAFVEGCDRVRPSFRLDVNAIQRDKTQKIRRRDVSFDAKAAHEAFLNGPYSSRMPAFSVAPMMDFSD